MFAAMDMATRALLLSGHDVLIDETSTTEQSLLRYFRIDINESEAARSFRLSNVRLAADDAPGSTEATAVLSWETWQRDFDTTLEAEVRFDEIMLGADLPGIREVASQLGVVRVANIVDPNYTVVAKFPKRHLPAKRTR